MEKVSFSDYASLFGYAAVGLGTLGGLVFAILCAGALI